MFVAGAIFLSACGGGGGTAPENVLRGQFILQQEGNDAILGLRGGFEPGRFALDAEPNDTLLSAIDLGADVPDGGIVRSGRLSSVDVRDVYRLGRLSSDDVHGLLFTLTSSGDVEFIVFRRRSRGSDTGPLGWQESLRMRGGELAVEVGAGDDFVLVVDNRSAATGIPTGYRFQVTPVDVQGVRALASSTTAAPGAEWADVLGGGLSVVPGEIIVGSRDGDSAPDADALRDLGFVPVSDRGSVQRWALPGRAGVRGTGHEAERVDVADRLRRVRRALGPGVYVSANTIASLDCLSGFQGSVREPNDPLFKTAQWNLQLSRLPMAWSNTTGDSAVHIAIMDTGLMAGHPDLAARVSSWSYDFISDPKSAGDGDGPDTDVSEPEDVGKYTFLHGTYVAGVACASTNNGVGIAGGTWTGKLLALRVIGVLGSSSFDRIDAWRYIAGLSNASGKILPVAERPKVLSMSFGLPSITAAEREAIKAVYDAGILMFAAVGNEGLNPAPPRYPAALDEVIGVGAVDADARHAVYSNIADYVEVVAAGGQGVAGPQAVTSTWAYWDLDQHKLHYVYNSFSGTSLATPLVAATAALMDAVHPGLELPTVREVLARSSVDLGAPGLDPEYGYGLLDAPNALTVAKELDRPPFPDLSPLSFDFGRSTNSTTISIRNSGGRVLRDFSITRIRGAENVFSFKFSSEHAPANLEIKLDRSSLDVGNYADLYRFDSNGGQAVISLLYRVPIPPAEGTIKINVYRESSLVASTQADSEGRFEIRDLPAGSYTLEAGVDRNANGRIGDSQEWFLSLPVEWQPSQAVSLTGLEIPWKN